MSHVVSVELEITDLEAFAAACVVLGGEYVPHDTKWRWWGRWLDDYHGTDAAYQNGIAPKRYGTANAGIVRFPGCMWDVGLYQQPSMPGAFVPVFYNYSGGHGLVGKLGADCEKLREEYGVQVALRVAARKGWKVQRTKHPQTGRARLVCSR